MNIQDEKLNEEDLDLKNLNQYYGSEHYYKTGFFKSNLTDGIEYLMRNGYAYFITDSLAVLETDLKDEEFCCIKLEKINDVWTLIITDGNDKVFYKNAYKIYCSARRELKLFWANGVLLLSGEW